MDFLWIVPFASLPRPSNLPLLIFYPKLDKVKNLGRKGQRQVKSLIHGYSNL